MPRTFFALCVTDQQPEALCIPLSAALQAEMEQVFDDQEQKFLKGRDEIIPFDGDWKPDSNQLLQIEDETLAEPFSRTLETGPLVYEALDISDYDTVGIKGIFTHSRDPNDRILLQRFQTSQYLQRNQFQTQGPATVILKQTPLQENFPKP